MTAPAIQDDDLVEEVYALATTHVSDTATPEEFERLETLLQDEAAREVYLDYIEESVGLYLWAGEPTRESPAIPTEILLAAPPAASIDAMPAPNRLQRFWSAQYDFLSNYLVLSSLISLIVLAIVLLSLGLIVPRLNPAKPVESSIAFVATITATEQATWDKSSAGNRMTLELFADETLVLNAGLAEVTFADGAVVVLEGPCRFETASASGGRLQVGRLRATVPKPAIGFTIDAPGARIVDLGTEFGMEVSEEGMLDVIVMEGTVDCVPQTSDQGGAKRVRLVGGQGARIASDGQSVTVHDRIDATVSEKWKRQTTLRRTAAVTPPDDRVASAELRKDAALIALLDFEADQLPPDAPLRVQGRWSDSKALQFARPSDHLTVNIDGNEARPQVTLATWLRIDDLGRPYQAIFHNDDWDEQQPGQVHWMITDGAKMRFAVSGQEHPESATSLQRQRGRWLHLAVVYNSDQRTARFYVNGEFDNEVRLEQAAPIRLGPSQLGNWSQADRQLGGRVDEFVLLGRALSDAEIRELFEAGDPY